MKNFENIEKFLDGELSDEELALFKAELVADEELIRQVDLHIQVDKAIMEKDVIQFKDQLSEIHQSLFSKDQKGRKVKLFKSWYLAAASILILALIGSMYFILFRSHSYTNEELYNKYYDPYEVVINVRSGNIQINERFVEALQKYQKHDYTGALAIFETISKNDSSNVACNFYSGVSFMETSRYLKAIKSFNSVIWQNDNLFIEQTEWYLGLCYLKTNKMNQAKFQFDKIANSTSFYKDKAKSIIENIR